MAIMINTLTLSSKAAANAVVGALTLYDAAGTARAANFILDTAAAGFFGISGNNLVAVRACVPAGFYGVHVCGNAETWPRLTRQTLSSQLQPLSTLSPSSSRGEGDPGSGRPRCSTSNRVSGAAAAGRRGGPSFRPSGAARAGEPGLPLAPPSAACLSAWLL